MAKEITKLAPRIDSRAAAWYREVYQTLNYGVEFTLESTPQLYRQTLNNLKGKFTGNELMLMLDVFDGSILTPGLAGQHLSISVADGIALDHLDKKWKVDKDELNNKIASLTIFESTCLELWACAYWLREPDIEEYVREMTK